MLYLCYGTKTGQAYVLPGLNSIALSAVHQGLIAVFRPKLTQNVGEFVGYQKLGVHWEGGLTPSKGGHWVETWHEVANNV